MHLSGNPFIIPGFSEDVFNFPNNGTFATYGTFPESMNYIVDVIYGISGNLTSAFA